MKRKFTPKERADILAREGKGVSVAQICRDAGITRTTFYEWRCALKSPWIEGLSELDIRLLKKNHDRFSLEHRILSEAECSKSSSVEDRKQAAALLAKKYPLKTVCRVLDVSVSAIHYRRDYKPEKNKVEIEDEMLSPLIKELFEKSHATYGSMKIKRLLERNGFHVSRPRVAKLMEKMNLICMQKKYRSSEGWGLSCRIHPNRLRRHFLQDSPNKAWCSDSTYIAVGGTWHYVCAIIDLYSRKVVGWGVSDVLTPGFVKRVFENAFNDRGQPQNLLFHSDQGKEFTSYEFEKRLSELGVQQSFSRPGSPLDNAVAESFFYLMKVEKIGHKSYTSMDELKADVEEYIRFFNEERVHTRLDIKTPCEVEREYNEKHPFDPPKNR